MKKGRTRAAGARPRCRGRCRRRASDLSVVQPGRGNPDRAAFVTPRSRGGRRCRSGWSAPGRAGREAVEVQAGWDHGLDEMSARRRVGRMDVRISSITVCRSKRRRCELVWSAATRLKLAMSSAARSRLRVAISAAVPTLATKASSVERRSPSASAWVKSRWCDSSGDGHQAVCRSACSVMCDAGYQPGRGPPAFRTGSVAPARSSGVPSPPRVRCCSGSVRPCAAVRGLPALCSTPRSSACMRRFR